MLTENQAFSTPVIIKFVRTLSNYISLCWSTFSPLLEHRIFFYLNIVGSEEFTCFDVFVLFLKFGCYPCIVSLSLNTEYYVNT